VAQSAIHGSRSGSAFPESVFLTLLNQPCARA
jgi:hypothetical protein